MKLNTGFDISADPETFEFSYGEGVFGPSTEKRHLDDIRQSLSDPNVEGPDIVYSVAMDVGKEKDREDLIRRNMLYGAMIYEKGIIGQEPVRSQGHIHAISPSCNDSTCEVYEIWGGEAYIYMQETAGDDPGRCFAVYAKTGDVVIVPPGWAHCTINANVDQPMYFGAWCVRDYGFDYKGVREHKGVAWFPKVNEDHSISFVANPHYNTSHLEIVEARDYPEFGIEKGVPIYTQYEMDQERFMFVPRPERAKDLWKDYRP